MVTKFDIGHKASVLCIDTGTDTGASGDEDGSLILWSRSGEQTEAIKIGDGGVNSIKFSKTKPEIFATCGTAVHQFDLRYLPNRLFIFEFNQEEINQIDLNPKEEFLAAGDDMGHIKIINIREKKTFKTLRKQDDICSTLCFRPNQNWELVSGALALDCGLMRWDFQRGKCIKQFTMSEMSAVDNDDVTSYLVSPPFVHTTSITSDGNYLSCGVENGTVQVFDTSKKAVNHLKTFRGHSKGVAQVHFTSGKKTNLVSGGNDGLFIVWDITKPNTNINAISTGAEALGACLKVVDHKEKINWLSSWPDKEHTLLLADQTSFIHSYEIQ